MKMFRRGGYGIGAVLLMLGIGLLICYMLFAGQPDFSEGTLVEGIPGGVNACFLNIPGKQVCA